MDISSLLSERENDRNYYLLREARIRKKKFHKEGWGGQLVFITIFIIKSDNKEVKKSFH